MPRRFHIIKLFEPHKCYEIFVSQISKKRKRENAELYFFFGLNNTFFYALLKVRGDNGDTPYFSRDSELV